MDQFFSHTNQIQQYLSSYLTQQKEKHCELLWTDVVFDRLSAFSEKGKAIRGNAILFIGGIGAKQEEILPLAAAMELLHAAILILDDVIDDDSLRRGIPSMHKQMESFIQDPHAPTQGKAIALCVEMIGVVLAYELIEQAIIDPDIKRKIINTLAREISVVTLGEMQDVVLPHGQEMTLSNVLATYKAKTARYTFSLPFALGGYCAQLPEKTIQQLETLGEHLGIMFQLQDDTIGLFGTQEEIGKAVGSDIREGKRTPHMLFLLEVLIPSEKQKVLSILGNKGATPKDILTIKELMKNYQIQEKVNELIDNEAEKAERILSLLEIMPEVKQSLHELVIYNKKRTA